LLRRRLRILLGFIIGAVFIVWFASRLDWPKVRADLVSANLTLIAIAVVLIATTYLIRSFRWRTLLSPIGKAGIGQLYASNAIGFAAIFLLGRGGEFVRPVIASIRAKIKFTATLATILIERVFDSITVGMTFSLSLLFFNYDIPNTGNAGVIRGLRSLAVFLIALCVTGALLLRFASRKSVASKELTKATGIGNWIKQHLHHLLHSLVTGLQVFRNRKALIATICHTIILWACAGTASYLVLVAFKIHLTFTQVAFVLGFEMIGSLVPTPGGAAGAFHAATQGALQLLGVEANQAASCAIILHLVTFGPALVFGLFFVLRDHISLSKLNAISEDLAEHPDDLTIIPTDEASIH